MHRYVRVTADLNVIPTNDTFALWGATVGDTDSLDKAEATFREVLRDNNCFMKEEWADSLQEAFDVFREWGYRENVIGYVIVDMDENGVYMVCKGGFTEFLAEMKSEVFAALADMGF